MTSEELKQKRIELGLSQEDLGKAVNKSRKTINGYENGDFPEPAQKLLSLYFKGVTKGDMKKFEPTKKDPPSSMQDLLADAMLEKLMPVINKVLDSHQKIIKELLQQGLEIDELLDEVQELKETTSSILKEVKELH